MSGSPPEGASSLPSDERVGGTVEDFPLDPPLVDPAGGTGATAAITGWPTPVPGACFFGAGCGGLRTIRTGGCAFGVASGETAGGASTLFEEATSVVDFSLDAPVFSPFLTEIDASAFG